MSDIRVKIKARFKFLLYSPLASFIRFGKKLVSRAQIKQMRDLTRKAPLFLEIETTNICNASCIFCSYPHMKRKKGVMSLHIFQKVVEDYIQMGGGPVSLTPFEGEPLLDPHLKKRLEILKNHRETEQVIMTTNGIALVNYSDMDIRFLLENLYLIKLSIGGLDEVTYKTMFNVDCFSQVMNGVDRLLKIREEVSNPAHLSLAFRTNDPGFEARFRRQLNEYREKGVDISHIHVFTNNCGALENNENKGLIVARSPDRKHQTCIYPCMSMVVGWDGIVAACCEDSEDDDLRIGYIEKESLAEIWAGGKRSGLLDSFAKRQLLPVCRKCSGYQPDTIFADSCFNGLRSHQALPRNFIQFR